MLDEVSVMLTSASTQLSRKHCSSHAGLGQSSGLQTDQQALLPPLLLVRPQQHLVEEQQLTMMMTCTTSHVDCVNMSVFVSFLSALYVCNLHSSIKSCRFKRCLFAVAQPFHLIASDSSLLK